ncbi:DNA processing protein [Rhodococcus sp. 27YEA15]|uniref:DNA-processing protein DprA n=1 Tax=Rhodococcus sp. 27YEA15 TaxID=3156259 RepID=UPI003C7BD4A7
MTIYDPDTLAWAYLSRVVQGPSTYLGTLVEQLGVQEAARCVRTGDLPLEFREKTQARAHLDTARRDLDLMEAMGGRLVTPQSPEWPAWRMLAFDGLGRAAEDNSPCALWVVGSEKLADVTERSIAIVGTRASTSYGDHVTAEIAGDLAADGWTVISGAAFGIDGAAHRATLGVGGVTVAVLACGVDRAYPSGHARLLQQIARSGGVVSEYPPGTTPAKFRFLARNRLVAAMSDGIVVVEAGWRSGARNTATWGRRLGRPVMAVPGPVTSASSAGCHRMIREGEALLVANASDVVDVAGPVGVGDCSEDEAAVRALDSLSGNSRLVYEALPGSGSRSVNQLAEESGLLINHVRATLPLLELEGFAGSDTTGWFRIK